MSYFNFYDAAATNEYDITNNATDEMIEMVGIPIKYLPRTAVKQDDLFGEDVLSSYDEVIEVKMYLEDHTIFGGEGDLFQQFGMEVTDTLKLKVQQDRMRTLLQTGLGTVEDPFEPADPEVGDLLQFPFNNDLFEVTFVEDEEIFYTHGQQTTFTLSAKKFEYSGESLDTGDVSIDAIDGVVKDTIDDSLQEFQQILEFDENSPFGDDW
jgi:hypothetical protein